MAAWPCAAKARISSRHSQGFFSRLNLSTLWALVSFNISAGVLIFQLSLMTGCQKQKAHRFLWRWAFLKLNDYVLGSGFIGQRKARVALTATLAHLLAQNSHGVKVN